MLLFVSQHNRYERSHGHRSAPTLMQYGRCDHYLLVHATVRQMVQRFRMAKQSVHAHQQHRQFLVPS